jgi:quercetin dioxygenase-like cupin family protein
MTLHLFSRECRAVGSVACESRENQVAALGSFFSFIEDFMRHLSWSHIGQEQLNDKLSRKYISGEQITLAQLFLQKGCLVPEHQHVSEQVSLIITGCLKFRLEGQEIIVRSNEMLQIPPNARHSAEALEDSLVYDVFSPVRKDWLDGDDSYLRK